MCNINLSYSSIQGLTNIRLNQSPFIIHMIVNNDRVCMYCKLDHSGFKYYTVWRLRFVNTPFLCVSYVSRYRC